MSPKENERALGPALQEGTPWVKESPPPAQGKQPASHAFKKGDCL